MKSLILIIVFILLCPFKADAIPNLDSLEHKLKIVKTDSVRIPMLADLAWYYRNISPTKAIGFAKKGLELSEKNNTPDYTAEFNGTLGANYIILHDIPKAIEHYIKARDIALSLKDTVAAASFTNNLGVAYKKIRLYDKALSCYKLSHELYSKSSRPEKISVSLSGIASIYDDMGKYDISEDYYKRSLAIKTKHKDSTGMIVIYNNLALIFQNQKKFKQALDYLLRTLKLSRAMGDSNGVVTAQMNIGLNYTFQKDYSNSIQSFNNIVQLAKSVEDKRIMIELYNYYGAAYLGLNQYENARKYINMSLELSTPPNQLIQMNDSYGLLVKVCLAEKNYEKAFYFQSKQMELKDSLFDKKFNETLAIETAIRTAEKKSKNDFENKNKTIDLLQKNNEIKQTYITYLWIFLILLILFIAASLFMYRIIRKNNRALSKSYLELKEKDDQLNQTIVIKDKFFNIVGHDLKNPLGLFQNVTDYLARNHQKMSVEEIEHFLGDLKRSSKNLNNLLDNLILWSNLQTGKLNQVPEEISLDQLCSHFNREWADYANSKSVSLDYNLTENITVKFDLNLLAFIFKNLVSNAIKYSKYGTNVRIKIHKVDGHPVFDVTDNGVGIEDERLKDLLNYSKSHKTKGTNNESGTGMGLILVKHLLELNGGRLEYDSELGKGSSFRAVFEKFA